MKVVHINTFSTGGAAKAAINLHLGLINEGVDSHFLYLTGPVIDIPNAHRIEVEFNIFQRVLFKLGLKTHYWEEAKKMDALKLKEDMPFSFNYTDFDILNSKQANLLKQADIIHLHWIVYLIDYVSFFKKIKKRIVWTLHDMNAFTGGCHYSFNCEKFTSNCASCPQLVNPKTNVFAKKEIEKKFSLGSKQDIQIVALNDYMLEKSKSSNVFKYYNHTIIPNSIDTEVFRYNQVRRNSKTKRRVGFVATYHSDLKGSDLFLLIVDLLKDSVDIEFVYIGVEYKLNFKNVIYEGQLNTDLQLTNFYQSLDLLIVPSRGDNAPNVIIEALCCGVPVLSSNVGGIPSLLNSSNGYLMQSFDSEAWKSQILKMLLGIENFDAFAISDAAVKVYNKKRQVAEMVKLYTCNLHISNL